MDQGFGRGGNLHEMRSFATESPHGGWAGPDGCLGSYIREESEKTLKAYKEQPHLVDRDGRAEGFLARGGYAGRQLFELVQNSADSLEGAVGGRIQIHLTPQYLYCTDEGSSIDKNGVTALMFHYMSTKKGTNQIGRFGLGFNAVLAVTDNPEFFSRLGSFRFSRSHATKQIKKHVPDAQSYPCLTLAYPMDPVPEFNRDPLLYDLSSWATNIVRLPLESGKYEGLLEQIQAFPSELLLFVKHVSELIFHTDKFSNTSSLSEQDGLYFLNKDGDISAWKLFENTYELSNEALEDGRPVYENKFCRITWAVPIDRMRSTDYGKFWIYFPTKTASLISGILNALWKPHEDRHNLLPGVYNKELIHDAVSLIVDSLSNLNTKDDPALHLDALPRSRGDGELTNLLRHQLYMELKDHKVVPDQDGVLQKTTQVQYPPKELPAEALKRWASSHNRPSNWLHHSALTRRATIDRIFQADDEYNWRPFILTKSAPVSSISDWLEALVENINSKEDAVQASIAAIQTAALIPEDTRCSVSLGKIVFTADNGWQYLDPRFVYLSNKDHHQAKRDIVHPQLEADADTLRVLKEVFELIPITSDISFQKRIAILYRKGKWEELWELSQHNILLWQEVIQNQRGWRDYLKLRNLSGEWKPFSELLLPGSIVPDDGTRDKDFAVDINFHSKDIPLLKSLGMSDIPNHGYDYKKRDDSNYRRYLTSCFDQYRQEELPSDPRKDKMGFLETITVGPLNIFEHLSEEGKVKYTNALLNIKETFDRWTMYHSSRDSIKFDYGIYPRKNFVSPAIDALLKHGRVELYYGIVNLSLGIGQQPDPDVRNWLLKHRNSTLIRKAFNIDIVTSMRAVDTTEPLPLIDEWPGLKEYLDPEHRILYLIRCNGFEVEVGDSNFELDCYKRDTHIYLKNQYDEEEELKSVLRELGLDLTHDKMSKIILRQSPSEVSAARAEIYDKTTNVERILAAVGEESLLSELPEALQVRFNDYEDTTRGLHIAEAAIATYDVGTLQKYRYYLSHLMPPKQWAGRNPAIEFVTSLGFGVEWAGQPNISRPPFVEVTGPYSLPCLHPYQRKIADNLRMMLRADGSEEKRGLISLPTGSGKTRIAVQSIVEAICEEEYIGDVLWIADRDELCEQAVEAWHKVWSNMGVEATPLRISRLWQGNKTPPSINYQHVIIASIQTLTSRVVRRDEDSRFLEDCRLVVFDEAHRSIARTYTEIMAKLGLTYRRKANEPLLLGLTATPYRGRNEEETMRLINRYGQNRLDAGVFESDDAESVTYELQSTGVLAQADHETIEGSHFVLTDDELRDMLDKRVPWLPERVEKRIGLDQERTERILKAYDQHIRGRGWPTLIFATSVDHAKTLAALLTLSGVKARSVDGETPPSIRRKVVEDFREGRLEVLVNYGVFREGFDAPRTRGIMVARPVYSPNLYFQMIGRGLRGPKNGGNKRCLILNVMDNIENYEEKLAFTELDWLWASDI